MIWVDDNDNSYGLENRSKFEKLSKEQTLFYGSFDSSRFIRQANPINI